MLPEDHTGHVCSVFGSEPGRESRRRQTAFQFSESGVFESGVRSINWAIEYGDTNTIIAEGRTP